MITRQNEHRKVIIEVNEIVEYIYIYILNALPVIYNNKKRLHNLIIHNNISTYIQVHMLFYEANPVPDSPTNKFLLI